MAAAITGLLRSDAATLSPLHLRVEDLSLSAVQIFLYSRYEPPLPVGVLRTFQQWRRLPSVLCDQRLILGYILYIL